MSVRVRVTLSTEAEVEVESDPREDGQLPYKFKHLDRYAGDPQVEAFLLTLEHAAMARIAGGDRAVESFELLEADEDDQLADLPQNKYDPGNTAR